tara:strand:- start:150 stop:425 length:276 start_codon:yes stop_codon:yes gene_type:complete
LFFFSQGTTFGVIYEPGMRFALHSLSVYEEIVAHANLNMMTKLTDSVVSSDISNVFGAMERSDAFRRAWIAATEATLVERKEGNLLPSDKD